MPHRPAARSIHDASLPDLGRRLVNDLIRMVRLDVKLAIASAKEVAVFATEGTALLLAGTLVGTVGLVLLLTGIGMAVAMVLPGWLVAFIGGVALIAIAIPVAWRSWRALTGG